MTISADRMRTKTERSNEQYAKNLRTNRFLNGSRAKVPDFIKDEIVEEIIIEIAMAGKMKRAKKAVREIIDLWVD